MKPHKPDADSPSSEWRVIPDRCGHVVISVEDKKILVLIIGSETGHADLRVAGFYMGKEQFVGEYHEKLAVLVGKIPKELHQTLEPKIRQALPSDLRSLPLSYL